MFFGLLKPKKREARPEGVERASSRAIIGKRAAAFQFRHIMLYR